MYVFILKRGDKDYQLLEKSVSISVSKDLANFSFNTPYMINFWQPFDINLLELGFKAIREKADKMTSDSTRETFSKLVSAYLEKKDDNNLKAALAVANLSGLSFDFDTYNQFITQTNTLGCLAVKFSGAIMGEIYFNQNVLPKAEVFNADSQTAFGIAAQTLYSKQSVPVIGKILNKVDSYSPSSSDCFPYKKPPSNKEFFVRALIEIDAPDALKILALQIDSGDADWLAKVLAIVAEYEGPDLTELVLKAATNERLSERKFEFNSYFDKIKSKGTAETLISLFGKNDDLYWKKTILITLGKYQFPESLPFLISVLNENPKEEIRTAAAMAMGELGQAAGAKPLYDFIVREKSILAKSIGIESLARINDKSVQGYLKELISNETDRKVREDAANALEDNLFILRYGREKK